MNQTIRLFIIIGILQSLVACASIVTTACEPQVYGGAKFDAGFVKIRGNDTRVLPYVVLAGMDFLPSAIFDTVLLIYTVPYELIYEEHERRSCKIL